MVFGLGALGIVGCGGANWEETAEESDIADESGALTETASKSFLSLGDSIAFGFNPLVPFTPATNFIGYPEFIASKGNKVTNASCPGETSGSFLNPDPLAEPDNGCRAFKANFALHADYETTQMAYLLSALRTTTFSYITLNLGANDLFLLQAFCADKPDPLACIQGGLQATIDKYTANLKAGYKQVKDAQLAAKYKGKFIALTTYATNYNDPLAVGALTQLNNALVDFTTKPFSPTDPGIQGKVVDGFKLFQAASAGFGGDACAAGLLIKKPDNSCDIHPSQAGREILGKEILKVAK
jgi:hypothetical protein